jgi:cyclic pyranopterin phosphate synthase
VTVLLGLPRHRGAQTPTDLPDDRPAHDGLLDTFGRVATDLRVSLTDRCNLRCSYCMPEEGLAWMPTEQLLRDDELIRLVTLAVTRLGVEEVRFTGGEPLLRKGLEDLVGATHALRTRSGAAPQTSLTTNAVGLARRAGRLAAAGLDRVNVSLDTLDPQRFADLTHRDRHADVLAGLRAATAAGLGPVKINAVLMRGTNDDEAGALLRWSLREGYELRFIEQMPLDPHGAWDRDQMIDAADVLAGITGDFAPGELVLREQPDLARGAAPAELWDVSWDDAGVERTGTVGIIASVTRPFCRDCDRTRLTADGQVRDCLFSTGEHDLRAMLRAGASDDEIADAWRVAMWGKQAGHGIGGTAEAGVRPSRTGEVFARPERPMSAIGG